MTDWSVIL